MTTTDQGRRTVLGRRYSSAEPRSCSLAVRNLSFTDDDGVQLFDGAHLTAEPGSKICVVGSSGKDQAALLALVLGLYRPERGTITVDGVDVASLPLRIARSMVALVLQDPWLTDGTIAGNIAFGHRGATRAEIEAVGQRIGLDRFVELMADGYDTVIDRRGTIRDGSGPETWLSVGQRRRIALARALVRNPGILLLEEPTSGLGVDEERLMIRAIDAASLGRTTIMATHRLSLARRSDAVMVVDRKRIVPYRGNSPDSNHSRLWDLQVPPVITPTVGSSARTHLRIVGPEDRRVPLPTSGPWGIAIGSELAPGYLASGLLGRDALTETWVAWSVEREEPVRVKVPRAEPVTYAAFDLLFREFKTLQALNHPGMATTYGADLDAEMPYAVFEYLDSTSLARVVQRRGSGLDALDVLYTGFELAGTIDHLHQRGYVHLNLRAHNVRTRHDTIVITDFAGCLPVGAPLRAPTGSVRARRLEHRYLAPEFSPGRPADPKMDVYALGALMHRATAGSVVTRVTPNGVGLVPYASLTEAPGAMADIVDAMVSRDPADRPEAARVLSEFRRILPSSLVRPRVSTAAARSPRLRLVGANN